MTRRKVIWIVVIALILFFVVTQPSSAAQAFQNIGDILGNAANSIITFFTELV